jgi:mannosyltransferase
VLAGILTIGVVYALARLLVGRLAAVLSTALAVVSPLLVWYSREGRMYAVTWLFVMLSFLALVQAVRTRHRPWLFLYAILIAVSLYTDISAVMALVPQAIVVAWFFFKSRDDVRAWWLRIGAAYLAGWLLFGPWLAVLPRQLPLLHGTFAGYEPGLATAWRLVLNVTGLAAAYGTLDALQVPVALAALLILTYGAAVVGAVWLGRDHRLFTAIALSLTLGPALTGALLVAVGSQGVLLPRVMGLTVFGLVLALGGSAELAWRALRPRRLALAAVPAAGLIALAATTLSLANVEAHGSKGQDWRAVATLVTQRAQPGDALIYYAYGLKYAVDAYLPPTSPWIRDGVGLWASPASVAEAQFAKWAAGHPHVWFVFYASGGIDMPAHDAWFRANGYKRIAGDPAAPLGILEYIPASGKSP